MRCQKLKALEETRSFYKVELKKGDLTEKQKNKYLRASKLVEGFIEKEKKPGKEKKKNPFLNPDGSLDLIDEFPSYKKGVKKNHEKINNNADHNFIGSIFYQCFTWPGKITRSDFGFGCFFSQQYA